MRQSHPSSCIEVVCFCCGELGNFRVSILQMDYIMCRDCVLISEVGAWSEPGAAGRTFTLQCRTGEHVFVIQDNLHGSVEMAAAATMAIEFFEDLKEFIFEATQFKPV